MNIEISIIVPCYNQAEFLEDALQSVLDQRFESWECIIVNDGSDDDTEIISKNWVSRDTRFKYFYKSNGGLCEARNYGVENAVGEFILPLDADDKIAPKYIEYAIDAFKKDNQIKLVYSEAEKFQEENGLWVLPDFSLEKLSQNNLIFCSAVFRKKDWSLVGGYDTQMKYGWEDWEFYISLLKNGGDVVKLDYIGFYYRIKASSMLTSVKQEQGNELLEYLSVKHADFFVKYYGSFHQLKEQNKKLKQSFHENLNSEKFVIDAFLKKFLGFTIFGMLKKHDDG